MQLGMGQNVRLVQATATQQIQEMRRIQIMKVLECQRQELQDYLEMQYEENPCLEIREKTLEPEDIPERMEDRLDEETERFDKLEAMSDDISYFQEEYSRPSHSAQEEMSDKHQDWLENLPENPQTLQEYLCNQLALMGLEPRMMEAVERIIYALDDHGFLTTPIVDLFGSVPEDVLLGEEALKIVQTMEPSGVGAQNLKECLKIQILARMNAPEEANADDVDEENPFDYPGMLRLLTQFSRDLGTNSIPKIARESNLSIEKVNQLRHQIARLNPNPGRDFSPRGAVVKPDLYCIQDENGKWMVTLDESEIPDFYVNTRWGKDCRTDAERDYIYRKQNAAQWILEAIRVRRETLVMLGNALIQVQAEFLEKGMKALKPLTEKQLATMIGKHPSTVSRAIREKWIQTPHGLFPLSAFFSASVIPPQNQALAIAQNDTESASRDAVQQQLLELIENEDKKLPLSDEELAKRLNIARTTINKYRKELNIPSSRQRKVY